MSRRCTQFNTKAFTQYVLYKDNVILLCSKNDDTNYTDYYHRKDKALMNAYSIQHTAPQYLELKQNKPITEELYKHFVAYLDATPKTIETYRKSLKQFFLYLAHNELSAPRRADILEYKKHLVASGFKPTTIQSYLSAVRLFFNWTAQEGYYPNIAEHIKGIKLSPEYKKDCLTSTQVKAVLGSIDRATPQGIRDYAMLSLMIIGGLRTIEVVRANVGDLRNLGNLTVLYIQGKGKTEKTAYIKVPAEVERALREYLSLRASKAEDALFCSTSNNSSGARLTTRSVSGIVKARLVEAGYNSPRLTAHSLRHTAVTISFLEGRDVTEVQQFARHADINTTMIYNHALELANNGCSEAISRAIFS